MNIKKINTLGELKESGWKSRSVKDEIRENLMKAYRENMKTFPGIIGFDDTVIPDIERALLSRHNILLLGLRGQAKTRIARQLTDFLDEYMPIVSGSELNDDPLNPLSKFARELIAIKGDDTPIEWVHRSDRYVEKLATPDVSIADLIGDVDPIKAANMKLSYGDERVIHFGLIPRAHRSIFVINELPDLQARIQVSLFNILQEGDIQIRGFKLRLPLDIQFVFTANPEDYTNRGSIITPLKDRIESQILTHYPEEIHIARQITEQEALLTLDQRKHVRVPDMIHDLIEYVTFNARESEYIDEKSGVSARLSISALENIVSTAERRMLLNGEESTTVRLTDLWGTIPAITGKVELVYEGEQVGAHEVAMSFINMAFRDMFLNHFPDPNSQRDRDPYGTIKAWFSARNILDLHNDSNDKEYQENLMKVAGLQKLVKSYNKDISADDLYLFMELVLNGLAEYEVISKDYLVSSSVFQDPLAGMLDDL